MTLVEATSVPEIPLESEARTYPKRGLPPSLSSTYPHGHISGRPRSPNTQRSFEARKATILRNMNAAQIEDAYQDTVGKINAILEEDRKRNEEVDREVEKLRKQREMERKLFWKMMEESGRKGVKKGAENEGKGDEAQVKEEGEA
ncbi:hypothetical protein MMC24_003156 [Lignoscripta atroalba]|nr:hypothetical protein [Lignoscripta atroalba]